MSSLNDHIASLKKTIPLNCFPFNNHTTVIYTCFYLTPFCSIFSVLIHFDGYVLFIYCKAQLTGRYFCFIHLLFFLFIVINYSRWQVDLLFLFTFKYLYFTFLFVYLFFFTSQYYFFGFFVLFFKFIVFLFLLAIRKCTALFFVLLFHKYQDSFNCFLTVDY